MDFIEKCGKEKLRKIIEESNNYNEVLIKLGRSINSGSNKIKLSQFIKDNNIDISHFDTSKPMIRTPENTFIENSTASQNSLRRLYKRGNYSEYKCAICGLEPSWNGKDLILRLDHINGQNTDDRLENLRWICPNCDSQLPTYGARNLKNENIDSNFKKIYKCTNCGKILKNKTKTSLCKSCYFLSIKSNPNQCSVCGKIIDKSNNLCLKCENEKRRLIAIKEREDRLGITRSILKEEIRTTSFSQLAKKYQVSDKTIRKWCKAYNLPSKASEIKKYTNEEWEKL